MVLPSDPLPILTNLMTLSKLFRPLRVRLESGLIDMRRDIASHAGVRVLEPDEVSYAPISSPMSYQVPPTSAFLS
jgi:hypothetical protein